MLEAWKTLTRRRDDFSVGFAQPILSAFIEEIHDTEDLPLPSGAPHFLDARAAYCRARWMGPGRGWVDPVAEKKGAILGMDAGLSTLEMESAENAGEDWEEMLDQRAREIAAFKERGSRFRAGHRLKSWHLKQLEIRRQSEFTAPGAAAV